MTRFSNFIVGQYKERGRGQRDLNIHFKLKRWQYYHHTRFILNKI
jgi:hypothetical protein